MKRHELEKKAKELGIDFNEDTTDEDLKEAVEKAEELNKDKDNKENDPEYWKNEAKAAFDARDIAKNDARKLKTKMKELEDKLNDAVSADEVSDLKKELKTLKDFKAQIDKEKEEADLKNKTDLERMEIEFNKKFESFKVSMDEALTNKDKELQNIQDKLNQKDSVIKNLRKSTLKSEIMEAAARYGAYNPLQINGLLSNEFEYDENLDKFSKSITEGGKLKDVLSVDEVVKSFLSDPLNDNLVKTKIKTDGLDIKDDNKDKNLDKNKDKDKNKNSDEPNEYDPADEDLISKAEDEGFTDVNAYINVLKIKDKKMAKIQENRDRSES